jgi:glycerophosphoryl diester phosphodiesterase
LRAPRFAITNPQPHWRLKAHGLAGRSHLTSFSLDVLRDCRAHSPGTPLLVSADPHWIERKGGLTAFIAEVANLADIVALRHDFLAERFDEVIRLWPLERLGVWTVNDPDQMRVWLDRQVGHLTSDRPDLALQLRSVAA